MTAPDHPPAPRDGVVIARATLLPGTEVAPGVLLPPSASRPGTRSRSARIAPASAIRRYGQIIGFATAADRARRARARAELRHGRFRQGLRLRRRTRGRPPMSMRARRFQGIRRPDGRVATRNYIGILTSVNCCAHVAGLVADAVPAQSVHRRRSAGGLSQRRRRGGADPQDRLRHDRGRAAARCCAARSPATRGTRISPTSSCWASAAR